MVTDEERAREVIDDLAADINVPWVYRWARISHYYGDTVRHLLVAAAALMLLAAPFYTDNLLAELPFILIGTVACIFVAALTNPWKQTIISIDAILSGVGLVIFETWALSNYQTDVAYKFILREALAFVFLFALYFSTKTLRGMLFHQIGRPDSLADFVDEESGQPTNSRNDHKWRNEAREILNEKNNHEKLDFND